MRQISFSQAINEALEQEMARDDKVFIIGEDIASDIFPTTTGLSKKFGRERVINAPISEAGFTGIGIGAAIMGMRPIVEIMFMDFITIAMDMITNQAAKYCYMTGGQIHVPMVIRTTTGMGQRSGAQHSQNLCAWFLHVPGLKVVAPSTAYDAKGLLKVAIEDENPVLFIENRNLYSTEGAVPEDPYKIPLGRADIKRSGKDITVVASGLMTVYALRSAEALAEEGIDCEVIDLRSIVPCDEQAILSSVGKTGRLVTVDEGNERGGVGSEIVSIVMRKLSMLKSPAITIASPNAPVPTSPKLEDCYMVSPDVISQRIQSMMEN